MSTQFGESGQQLPEDDVALDDAGEGVIGEEDKLLLISNEYIKNQRNNILFL